MMQERYEIDGKQFWVIDTELKIDVKSDLEFVDRDRFASGQLRYETYRKLDKLHGPSVYYAKDGKILSKAWFFEGDKIGKSWRYYPTGQLYCLERFVRGMPHLLHEYYYLDGSVKTIIHFQNGVLHGETKLYWPDGTLKRESLFHLGKKEYDRCYDEQGTLIGST